MQLETIHLFRYPANRAINENEWKLRADLWPPRSASVFVGRRLRNGRRRLGHNVLLHPPIYLVHGDEMRGALVAGPR